jgi:hypothetical protein
MSVLLALRMRMSSPMQLAAAIEVHPGVIALREAGLNAEEQWLRVQSALQLINQSRDPDMVNRVLEIQSDVVVRWHEIPAS